MYAVRRPQAWRTAEDLLEILTRNLSRPATAPPFASAGHARPRTGALGQRLKQPHGLPANAPQNKPVGHTFGRLSGCSSQELLPHPAEHPTQTFAQFRSPVAQQVRA